MVSTLLLHHTHSTGSMHRKQATVLTFVHGVQIPRHCIEDLDKMLCQITLNECSACKPCHPSDS